MTGQKARPECRPPRWHRLVRPSVESLRTCRGGGRLESSPSTLHGRAPDTGVSPCVLGSFRLSPFVEAPPRKDETW